MPTTRYPFEQRWTGVLAAQLGEGFEIIEEGLSGRTTDLDDPADPRLNGSAYLPSALASHLPLDLVILQLGTNDTKTYFHRSAYDIAFGMSKLLVQVGTSAGGVGTAYPAPKALVIAPPAAGQHDRSLGFRQLLKGPRPRAANWPATTKHLPGSSRWISWTPANF